MSTTPEQADWNWTFAAELASGDTSTAEQWARALWENGPLLVRWFLVVGWRFVLGLRLGPLRDSDHILGWKIVERSQKCVTVELPSPLLHARNTFELDGDQLAWSTFVWYDNRLAKTVWLPVSVLHRPLVRYSLRRARRRGRRQPRA